MDRYVCGGFVSSTLEDDVPGIVIKTHQIIEKILDRNYQRVRGLELRYSKTV